MKKLRGMDMKNLILILVLISFFSISCENKQKKQVAQRSAPKIVSKVKTEIPKVEEGKKEEIAIEENKTIEKSEEIKKEDKPEPLNELIRPELPLMQANDIVSASKRVEEVLGKVKQTQEEFSVEVGELSKLGYPAYQKLESVIEKKEIHWKNYFIISQYIQILTNNIKIDRSIRE